MTGTPEKVRSRQAVGLCDPAGSFFDGACKKERSNLKEACDVDKSENNKFRDRREDRNKKIERKNRRPKSTKRDPVWVRNKTWKDDHCRSALFQINRKSLTESMKEIEEGAAEFQEYILEQLQDLPISAAKKAAIKQTAAKGATALCAALVFPPAIAVCMAAVTAASIIDAGLDAAELAENLKHLNEQLDDLKRLGKDAQNAAKAFNQDGSINDDELKKFQDRKVKEMTDAVKKNPCLKARRCFLTPYENTGKQGRYSPADPSGGQRRTMKDKLGSKTHSLADPRGCCPGMTGHHLVLNAWMDNGAGGTNCPNYNANDAPVVCVVGAGHSTGEHGEIHTRSDKLLEQHMSDPENKCKFTLKDAIDIGAEALGDTVGGHCGEDCIKEQLENHYVDSGNDGIGCKASTPMRPYHVRNGETIEHLCSSGMV